MRKPVALSLLILAPAPIFLLMAAGLDMTLATILVCATALLLGGR